MIEADGPGLRHAGRSLSSPLDAKLAQANDERMTARRPSPAEPAPGSGSQHALRAANVRRVAEALTTAGPMTQTVLAKATGLSNATVSNLVRVMSDDGLVTTARTTSSGRRAVLVRPVHQGRPRVALGLDIGRRHMRLVACTPDREVIADEARDLEFGHQAEATVAAARVLVDEVLDRHGIGRGDVIACGVGIPAPIDRTTGRTSHHAVLPEWSAYPLVDGLTEGLGLPVEVENDANLGALAELAWGGHDGVSDLILVKVATGVGAGLIVDSRLYRGASGKTGEIGHTNITEYGPLCRCGGRGCLEAIASCHAMLTQLAATRPDEPATLEELLRLTRAGDPASVRIVDSAGLALGRVLGGVVNLLNPQLVVIAGPILPAGDVFAAGVSQGLARFTSPVVGGPTEVVTSSLGGSVEALGGCALVLQANSLGPWARPEHVTAR